MSKFISLRILASLTGKTRTGSSNRTTPKAPPVGPPSSETPAASEEPTSASRISVSRMRVEG